jgi:S-adenosylmethionine uptake transporter
VERVKPASTATAFAVASLGIAAFSTMDAVMKDLSIGIGAYNALLWRTLSGAVIGGFVFFARRSAWPGRQATRLHLMRGILSAAMAMLFFWGLARVPLAQGVALSFVAPLIALYLAAWLLKEKIERQAILASVLGFAGVLVILAGQAEADLGPEAFQGALAILASAGLYAYNIILMRRQAQVALLAFVSLMLLSWAYARAEAQHLAPVEYTAFVWAAFFGYLVFDEPVRPFTLAGAAMIVTACIIAARRRPVSIAEMEAGL